LSSALSEFWGGVVSGAVEAITTDGLRSDKVAMTELGCADRQEIGRWANNRVGNSRETYRKRRSAALAEWQQLVGYGGRSDLVDETEACCNCAFPAAPRRLEGRIPGEPLTRG